MLDAFVERQARTLRGNKILIGLRLLLATLSLTVLLIQESIEASAVVTRVPLYLQPTGLIATIVCALTILYLLIARRSERVPRLAPRLALAQVFVDILLISVLIWHTGGVESQFVVLYLISICAAPFVLKWNVSILAAAVAATLFSLLTLGYSLGWIPETFAKQPGVDIHKFTNLNLLDFARLLLLPIGAFFLTGLLAGTLARRLASARLMHKEILEGIGEGILVVDNNCKVLYYNGEAQRLLGVKDKLEQMSLMQLLGETVNRQTRSVFASNVAARTEINHQRLDGSFVPLVARISSLTDPEEGASRAAILALADNTTEKKMEEFLKHRQRIETMGQISATIAHEIRNPLASIRGAVQELGRSLQIPENKKILLDIVLSESDRLDQIITDFLRFARMRPPRLQLTDLGRLLADIKLLLTSRPEAQGISITLSGDEGDPFPADPEQLRQLFLNLGVNAIQALNDRARRELNFRVQVVSLYHATGFKQQQLFDRIDRPGILVEVEDTGCGMSEAIVSHIFEPFFTTKSAGTGLGLAIVGRIVQAHEGLIGVNSRDDQGATFRVWLPTDLHVPAT
ncbi:MAG: ATP-binding protein [Planctomycetota bacterium]